MAHAMAAVSIPVSFQGASGDDQGVDPKIRGKQSKAKKRRLRRERTCILQAMKHSRGLVEEIPFLNNDTCPSFTEVPATEDAPKLVGILQSIAERLKSIELKLISGNSVQWNSFAPAFVPALCPGISASTLEKECGAVRCLQRWWRRSKRSHDDKLTFSLQASDLTGTWAVLPSVGTWLIPSFESPPMNSQENTLVADRMNSDSASSEFAVGHASLPTHQAGELDIGHVIQWTHVDGKHVGIISAMTPSLDSASIPEMCFLQSAVAPMEISCSFGWFCLDRANGTISTNLAEFSFDIIGTAPRPILRKFAAGMHKDDGLAMYRKIARDDLRRHFELQPESSLRDVVCEKYGSVKSSLHVVAVSLLHNTGMINSNSFTLFLMALCQILETCLESHRGTNLYDEASFLAL